MSGDSGGIILGLIAAPMLLAGAAAVGVAYGAIRSGAFLAKSAIDYAKKKKAEKALFVNNCSAELEGLYQDMQLVLQQQTDHYQKLSLSTQKKLDSFSADLQRIANEAGTPDLQALNNQIDASHNTITQTLTQHTQQVQKEIISRGRQQLQECAKAIDKAQRTKAALVDWRKQTQADQSQQQILAYSSLRDAVASVKLIERLAYDSRTAGLKSQYLVLREACDTAQKNFNDGLYESAFSGSRTVIRQVAMAVAAHQTEQMELDFTAMQLQARMEGLIEEMARRRYFTYTSEVSPGEEFEEDLDEFSQGEYSKTQQTLIEKLDQIRNPANLYEIQKMIQEFETELEPRASRVMQIAQQVMLGYHEKLKVLDTVSEFMAEQNYVVDWAAPVGDDLSQKLVVHFTNRISGSTISVTLDNRAESGDIAKMAMELLTFYDNSNEVSEQEKKHLRERLNEKLQEAGVLGQVACQGQVNLPSSQPQMNTESGVLKEKVRAII